MTAIKLKGVVKFREATCCLSISAVLDPSIRLHQYGRTKVLVALPPVARARRAAARAQDALVHAVELGPILARLQELGLVGLLWLGGLQPRLNAAVLLVEVAHVRDQVLDHVHVRERVNLAGLGGILLVNVGQARQSVGPIDVHGTRAANPLPTRTPKREGRVLLVLDFEQSICDPNGIRSGERVRMHQL
jgi:hypothetical protein